MDPDGLDVYKFDKKSGDVSLFEKNNDDYDSIGKFTKNGNPVLNRKGEIKIAISNIEKGILSEGQNWKNVDTKIDIGSGNRASQSGVEKFAIDLSEYLGRELNGTFYSNKNNGSPTLAIIGGYKKNRYNESFPPKFLNSYNDVTIFPIIKWHTHPTNAVNREEVSIPDKEYKDHIRFFYNNLKFKILFKDEEMRNTEKFY